MISSNTSNFYVTGGTVPRDAPSYIVRQADTDLLEGLRLGQFCYVLTSRQMGKSSLMVRTATQLRQEGATCAILDLTAIGQNLDAERWYGGLLNQLGQHVGLEDELDDFWLAPSPLGPMQKWMQALQQIVLKQRPGNLVIFVDEIDAVRSLPFSADEFFAGIRECYNRRVEQPDFERLTFCLLGVATPSDLIRDTRTTPFNIGKRITLTDFAATEVWPLKAGLLTNRKEAKQAGRLLARVLYWTGGHPYLTQRLCQALADAFNAPAPPEHPSSALVDHLCESLFLASGVRERDDNLIFVRERLLRAETDIVRLLDLYGIVRRGRQVPNDEADPRVSILHISGIVKVEERSLVVRNEIYARVFDGAWVRGNMPHAELRRQQKAFRKGLTRALALSSLIIIAMAGLAVFGFHQAHRANSNALLAAASAGRERFARAQADKNADEATRQRNAALAATLSANANAAHAKKEAARARRAEEKTKRALEQAKEQRREAQRQKGFAQSNEQKAIGATRKATHDLRASYLAQAQAARWSGRPGQHFAALDALTNAAAIFPSSELRDEAIAALALPVDIRETRKWRAGPPDTTVIAVDLHAERFARADARGNLIICRLADARELFRLPRLGQPALGCTSLFSPDGRFLAIIYESGQLHVWDLRSRQSVITAFTPPPVLCNAPVAFSADGRRLVVALAENGAAVYALPSCKHVGTYPGREQATSVALSPDGHRLASCNPGLGGASLLDLDRGIHTILAPSASVHTVAWSPDGRRVAMACDNFKIYISDADTGRSVAEMIGHQSRPTRLWFPRDDLLASGGWDPLLHFWDPRSGRQLLRTNMDLVTSKMQFRPDGRGFAAASGNILSAWEVGGGIAYRSLYPSQKVETAKEVNFSADGRFLMASFGVGGAYFWETNSARQAGFHFMADSFAALSPADSSFFTSGADGLRWWQAQEASKGNVEVKPVGVVGAFGSKEQLWGSRDGRLLCAIHQNHVDVYRLSDRKLVAQTGLHTGALLDNGGISPDNRWLVTSLYDSSGQFNPSGIRVWSVETGKLVKEFATYGKAKAIFSPDGRWLASAEMEHCRLWRVGTWQLKHTIPRPKSGLVGVIAFSPDSRILAVEHTQSIVHLLDPNTGTLYATLEAGESLLASSMHFSPDGNRLAIGNEGDNPIHLWDLGYLRHRLRAMNLDWNLLPAPPKLPLRVFMPEEPMEDLHWNPGNP